MRQLTTIGYALVFLGFVSLCYVVAVMLEPIR